MTPSCFSLLPGRIGRVAWPCSRGLAGARWRRIDPGTRWLLALWGLFALLVGLRIHGSSLPCEVELGRELVGQHEEPAYLFGPLVRALGVEGYSPGARDLARSLLLAQPRSIRVDEWGVFTPWALSQVAHDPPFPVVNTNLGGGQNMLLGLGNPVWHPSALARPSTWGFLLFGAERGLAWAWWFQIFACFTVLYLLLRTILGGDRGLAAFGAFWFCGSAYVVCWSLWPAYVTLFPALMCLAAYHLLTSPQRRAIVVGGLLLGLALPGFVMCPYPPWQVPLGWLFLLVLGALLWRERAAQPWRTHGSLRIALALVAVLVAVGLLGAYVQATLPAIQAMLGTLYPGRRFHAGGDYDFVWLLRGYYNAWTGYVTARGFFNASEAASFLHLFPALVLALGLSRQARRGFGGFGWLCLAYLAALLVYALVGYPHALAAVTLLGRSHPPRVDLAVGLLSIVLCTWYLHRFRAPPRPRDGAAAGGPMERRAAALAGIAVAVLVAAHGLAMNAHTRGYPSLAVIPAAAAAVGVLSWTLVAGRRRLFFLLCGAAVVATGAWFNPLSIGARPVLGSELVREIARLSRQAGGRPLWLSYEPPQLLALGGALIAVAGGRSVGGVHQYPHLELWRRLDPERRHEAAYNRYAHVELVPCATDSCLDFDAPGDRYWVEGRLAPNVVRVHVSPTHPALRALGARFVLAVGALQQDAAFAALRLRYRSVAGGFTIFEIPPGG
ncbi:MAG: hypothetical protein HY744_34170 [Deltaproteobacteria bacterium]|nr:hypothetical protein [Deltaproteobacteria bacterium]